MKKRLLIFISFILVMTIFNINPNVYAAANSDPLFSFTANKTQLKLMDALSEENPNISHGEILQKTAPDLWGQLPETVKKTLYNSRFKENNDDNPTGGTFKISAVLDPPSGRYRAFGNHLVANAETTGYEFISTSPWMDYINPYE